jgi:hypothetical protein
VWRHNEHWWGAADEALVRFGEGEVLDHRQMKRSLGGVPAPADPPKD